MAALIIAIFPQNSSRGNWEEQQDRTDPNSQFELARKPAWLLAFRQFGLPKWKHDFESFPAYDFWWKLSEDGSTQRKPKSCGILRILASVFRFYLNPPGFPSSSHFYPKLWPEDRTRIELHARQRVFTPISLTKNINLCFDWTTWFYLNSCQKPIFYKSVKWLTYQWQMNKKVSAAHGFD